MLGSREADRIRHYEANTVPLVSSGYWPKTPVESSQGGLLSRRAGGIGSLPIANFAHNSADPKASREVVHHHASREIVHGEGQQRQASVETRTDAATVVEARSPRKKESDSVSFEGWPSSHAFRQWMVGPAES